MEPGKRTTEVKLEVTGAFSRLRTDHEPANRILSPLWIGPEDNRDRTRLTDGGKTLARELEIVVGYRSANVLRSHILINVEHEDPATALAAGQDCLAIAKRYADFLNAVVYAEVKTEIDELILNDRIRSVLIDAEILTVKRLCDYTYGSLMNMGLSVGEVEIIERRLSERGLRLSAE